MGYVPVHFLYKSIGPEELTALYSAADVCFVTSIRDGMNLVSYEYVACHNDKAMQSSRESISHGSLVLSKFAGAADVLDGSILVDPWDPENCADALEQAVSMDADEADRRMKRLGVRVENHTR
jgi:trehalose 6-phosphate synthase